jgi:hypothetical protein
MKTPEEVYNETESRLELQMATMNCFFTPYDVIYAAMKDYATLYAREVVKNLNIPDVSNPVCPIGKFSFETCFMRNRDGSCNGCPHLKGK